MTYEFKQCVIRIKWNTFQRIKACFPPIYNESVSHYFERLAKWFEENGWRNLK